MRNFAVLCLLVVSCEFLSALDLSKYEKVGYLCTPGSDGDTKCALQCLFFQKYKNGVCNPDDSRCYCELKFINNDKKEPEPLGPCSSKDADATCGLQCLFYPRYNGGFCKKEENRCYCTRK